MSSALFSPTGAPESPEAQRRREHALAALGEWQESYLEQPAHEWAFDHASAIPPEHMLKDVQLARAIAEGARCLGGPCSHGVALPTKTQDRYEYVVLARYIEELRTASEQQQVTIPVNVLFGSLPTGHPTAQVVRPARSDDYLVLFHSGLFGYLYGLGRIVASCVPYEQAEDGFRYSLDREEIERSLDFPDREPSRYITPADAAECLLALLRACVLEGSPWAMTPTRVKRMLIPLAESLVDASHAFVVAHEFAHLMSGHLDRPTTTRHALGSAGAGEFVDYAWHDEMEADFLGMQAAMAACAARERPTIATYAGMNLYLRGVEILYEAIAIMSGCDVRDVEGILWPPLANRRRALGSGLEVYLAEVPDVRDRELAFSEAVASIVERVWEDCRAMLVASGPDPDSVARMWQATVSNQAAPSIPARPPRLGPVAYELLASDSAGDRELLTQIAPAVAVTLFYDAAADDRETRRRAEEHLIALDPEFEPHVPLIGMAVAWQTPDARLGDDDATAGMLAYASACIKERSRAPAKRGLGERLLGRRRGTS